MKKKVLGVFLILGLLFSMPLLHGQEKEEFGFTGEVREFEVKKLSISPEGMVRIQRNFPDALMVEPLAIGLRYKSYIEPDISSIGFYFITGYYPPISNINSYIGLIIINYGDKPSPETIITVEVKGSKNSKIQRKRSIPRMTVMRYVFKINLANEIGIYEVIGNITSPKIFSSSIKTRFYIEELW